MRDLPEVEELLLQGCLWKPLCFRLNLLILMRLKASIVAIHAAFTQKRMGEEMRKLLKGLWKLELQRLQELYGSSQLETTKKIMLVKLA